MPRAENPLIGSSSSAFVQVEPQLKKGNGQTLLRASGGIGDVNHPVLLEHPSHSKDGFDASSQITYKARAGTA